VSKEELERASVQELSSSVPPRAASDAPASLPSTPPVTDEIDTDWGEDDSSDAAPDWPADDSNEVTHVMDKPLRVVFTPPPPAEPDLPTSPAASVAPQAEPTPELETSPHASPHASPPPSEAEADLGGRARSMRPQAPTLIGLPAPTLPDSLDSEEPSTPDKRDSAPPPMPSAAFSEPVRAPSVPSPPPASVAGASTPPPPPPPPIAAPSAPPPPRSAPSAPPPSASVAPSAAPVPSSQPPAPAAPSMAPAARPSAPPARGSVPAPRVSPATPEAVTQAGSHSSGFGRWLLVLAAGLVVVCVLGYRVLSRDRTALAESAAATPPVEGPATTATATTDPAPTPPAAEAATTGSAVPPSAAATAAASAATADSAPAPSTSASPAPSTSANAGSEMRRVTVKSKPAKVRFFHFGKLVGVTPFVLQLKPGEKHAYEAGLPGYGTRKVVIDGSKSEILIGLTREKP